MNWPAHLVFGFILVTLIFYIMNFSFLDIFLFSLFGSICALIPDIDQDGSKFRQILDFLFILLAILIGYFISCQDFCSISIEIITKSFFISLTLLGLYFIFFKFFKPKHRGITHTLFSCIIFSFTLFAIFGFNVAMAGFIGYLSHLIADNHLKFF